MQRPSTTFFIKCAVVVLTVLALIFIDSGGEAPRSPEQKAFDLWFTNLEQDLRGDLTDARLVPELSIQARADRRFSWSFDLAPLPQTPPEPKTRDRMIRLLELMRTANIFSLAAENRCRDDCVQLEVRTRARSTSSEDPTTFVARFSPAIARTMPTATMLKLLETYSGEQHSSTRSEQPEGT